ncbi:amidohydrolase family protein [Pseudooceanicola onchidii]|uniref:amidohydrolase family protein n=1 Tax=Pseudooceanicola onchidii TaxID=2562279 RepID=UPI00145AA173|nr:amidohydrolase family protein [Pseudooceanicola onchidii]
MPNTVVTDAHSHVLSSETVAILQREVPELAPKLTPIDDEGAILEMGDVVQNPFPRGAWDLERRLADMARMKIDRQVVAVCPQTLLYGSDPDGTLAISRIQNDQISKMCANDPNRFAGLATAPMQAPDLAAAELTRAMREKGLGGAMIGTNIGGKNLDDPALDPFWAAADKLSAFILVHPIHVAGIDRQRDYYMKNIIGNPLDTTIAAACLVFGGVIERFPNITFFMSHGGGFTPYQAGRFVHGWNVRDEPRKRLKGHPQASLDKLTYDTILHAPEPLRFLLDTVGEDRVLMGTDYPFDMGQYDMVPVVDSLGLAPAVRAAVMTDTIERFLPGAFGKVPA